MKKSYIVAGAIFFGWGIWELFITGRLFFGFILLVLGAFSALWGLAKEERR